MNWIRKVIFFVTLLVMSSFAAQANGISVQKIESQKTDTNFCKAISGSSAIIQPEACFQLTANIKTDYPEIIKWFDSLLIIIPQDKALNPSSNFVNQFSTPSKKVLLMLYPFHFFW